MKVDCVIVERGSDNLEPWYELHFLAPGERPSKGVPQARRSVKVRKLEGRKNFVKGSAVLSPVTVARKLAQSAGPEYVETLEAQFRRQGCNP